MDNKLDQLFLFISNNRQYNKALQERFYNSAILSYSNIKDKVVSLLYGVANTQSQPKIDNLATFFKSIFEDLSCLSSFTALTQKIAPDKPINFESFYQGMINQSGWGQKTSALLSKSIFHLHNGDYSEELRIWNDVPKKIEDDEKFYLPVDAVIIAIFNRLDNKVKWNFDRVNSVLNKKYTSKQIEIWDDLWFWGFITQNGSGDERKFLWNENKYWALKESDKDENTINEIRIKSHEFLNIFN